MAYSKTKDRKLRQVSFSEPEIQALFGHEAAENESIERLRQYYLKTSTYNQVVNDLSLRILVGHKGIGKSALFQVAMSEDFEAGRLSILIKPNDIANIETESDNFLKLIKDWTEGLTEIIANKVLATFGQDGSGALDRLRQGGGFFGEFLRKTFKNLPNVDLSATDQVVLDMFLKTGKIIVYIDDLDRGWQGRPKDVTRVSALLNAVRDLVNDNKGLSFRVSLRSDVYYLVRTSDESTDKIENSVIWLSWENHEIFVLLIKRIETFFGRTVNEQELLEQRQYKLAHYLNHVMAERFYGLGLWDDVPMYRILMSLVRKRPRDLVKLCTLSARHAREKNHTKIETNDLQAVFEEYSQGRLQDTINEYRSELPHIERLLLNMKPTKKERTTKESYLFTNDELTNKIDSIRQTGVFRFSNRKTADTKDLIHFLYKINFLTARSELYTGTKRIYYEENRYLSSIYADFGFQWEIHPAYRWALQPQDTNDIYRKLELEADTK